MILLYYNINIQRDNNNNNIVIFIILLLYKIHSIPFIYLFYVFIPIIFIYTRLSFIT